MVHDLKRLKALVRTIPDFPKPGIMFRDVTTLILDPWGLKTAVAMMADQIEPKNPQKIVAIESRGFIFGASVAEKVGCGLVLARKKGKLPGETVQIQYQLEYGTDCLEIHKDAILPGERCIIVDDLLATGGTANAAAQLVKKMGGIVAGCHFVVNLPELKGTTQLSQYELNWLMDFDGH